MDASILDQVLDKVENLEGLAAYGSVFGVLTACGLGVPIPEDITLIVAGYLAHLENIEILPAIAVCFAGVLIGDFTLFYLGRRLGKRFFDLPGVRFVFKPERVKFAEEKLRRNARKVCFTARFLAGLRAPIYLSAGMLGVKPRDFLIMDGLAALISVPLITYLGYYFGDEIDMALHYMRRAERYFLIVFAVIGFAFVLHMVFKKLRGGEEK